MYEHLNVAIVDDNLIVRYTIRQILRSNEIAICFEAKNGKDCLEKMCQLALPPNIIILDMDMPVMNGLETTPIIKRKWPDTKVVIFSGNDDEDSINAILALGADSFLSKSSPPSALIEAINSISGPTQH